MKTWNMYKSFQILCYNLIYSRYTLIINTYIGYNFNMVKLKYVNFGD